jgi:hypothetical protein
MLNRREVRLLDMFGRAIKRCYDNAGKFAPASKTAAAIIMELKKPCVGAQLTHAKPYNPRSPMKKIAQCSFAAWLLFGTLAATAAQPSLRPLLQGKWRGSFCDLAYDVKVVGNYAYIALNQGGLAVFDISNPANPVRVGGYDTSGWAYGVAVSGNYAYVADSEAGLQVIDVSNPANPARVGGYDTSGWAYGVAVSGNYAYVADSEAGLQVIDVSNPANPVRVGGYDTSGAAAGVAVSGSYAYVADGRAGLEILDVSNPANPVHVGSRDTSRDTSGDALGVVVVADRIYVADGDNGLLVLPSLPNVQFTVRIEATPGVPFTLEATTNLLAPNSWTPLLMTNVSAMPFDYADFNVKQSEQPRKFYRVRQP